MDQTSHLRRGHLGPAQNSLGGSRWAQLAPRIIGPVVEGSPCFWDAFARLGLENETAKEGKPKLASERKGGGSSQLGGGVKGLQWTRWGKGTQEKDPICEGDHFPGPGISE